MQKTPHICMIPTPGMGHLIPLAELARRLTESFNFTITFLIPNDHSSPPTKSMLNLLNSLSSSISYHFLPPVDLSELPQDTVIETRIIETLTRSLPALHESLREMSESTQLVALVVDLFGYPVLDLAKEFCVLPYMLFTPSALSLCFGLFTLPKLDKMYTCEYRDLPEPVQICPGSILVHGSDFPDPVQDRKGEVYNRFLEMLRGFSNFAGILVNSFTELEPVAIKYLIGEKNIPPVYPIGPVVQTGLSGAEVDGSGCMKWLDEKPRGSVLFVSFGSGGTLSQEQIDELALGLELSGVGFLWVVKSPHNKIANATYFSVDSANEPLGYLPQGFLERTKGFGLVVPSWAPQMQVLAHSSIGGFLTHCGWNSIMESIVNGVPFIAWPLYAEQKFNANILVEDLQVGLRVKPNEKGLISREQVGEYSKSLIQGEKGEVFRERIRELKHKASVALSEGGSSRKSLEEVALVWMNHNANQNGCGQPT